MEASYNDKIKTNYRSKEDSINFKYSLKIALSRYTQ